MVSTGPYTHHYNTDNIKDNCFYMVCTQLIPKLRACTQTRVLVLITLSFKFTFRCETETKYACCAGGRLAARCVGFFIQAYSQLFTP